MARGCYQCNGTGKIWDLSKADREGRRVYGTTPPADELIACESCGGTGEWQDKDWKMVMMENDPVYKDRMANGGMYRAEDRDRYLRSMGF